jgi:UDP-N-acetyl-D-galactosamine dehydrogenase
MKFNLEKNIAVIGLGYVGLPLAVAFSSKYKVIGYDISLKRVGELLNGIDSTLEVDQIELQTVLGLKGLSTNGDYGLQITSDLEVLNSSNIFIVTVPTPIDKFNRPVLGPMIIATEKIGELLKIGDIVIYESTVYPGVTEDEMVPILEKVSGLKFNRDFFCGYSPERINPGDKLHTFKKVVKVTSGSTPEIAEYIDKLYKSVIEAGTFQASSIKVAEAAKVIENAQRDINIAFVNELSKIFNLLDIDTYEVLEAASTKWNFLNFKPGLVGGHCIGVDPFYLAQKAQEFGYHPEIILAGRRINDSMGKYVATEVIKLMLKKNLRTFNSNILILGFSFKEDCPDFRNTKVIDIYNELKKFEARVSIFDPWVDKDQIKEEFDIDILSENPNFNDYSVVILAVSHSIFKNLEFSKKNNLIVFDVKGVLDKSRFSKRL